LRISDSGLSVENVELSITFSAGLFHTLLHATREVHAGEELRYDYGPFYWDKHMKKNDFTAYRLCKDGVCEIAAF